MILTSTDGITWVRARYVYVDDAGHAALRVALEECRAGGQSHRDGTTVRHAATPTEGEPVREPIAP